MARKPVPYENATSGAAAREEIVRILQNFGCESVGFMDDFEKKEVVLAFRHRGRPVQLRVSAKGWASLWLQRNPWTPRRKQSQHQWSSDALDRGMIVVNSILRDWVKGQVTAIETGILSFEAVFMPYMLTNDGRPVIDLVTDKGLLPPPQ